MPKYTCRLIVSVVIYLAAVVLLFVGLLTYGWFEYYGYSFSFNGRSSANDTVNTNDYITAIVILLIIAISFASLCCLLSCIMFCADCCCRITKCMTVIPKIIAGFSTLAGVLADAACVVFLIMIYVDYKEKLGAGLKPTPSYSFFLVAVTGIFLMIAGCIISGVKHATKVEDSENGVIVVASESQSQSQGTSPNVNAPGYLGAAPFYQPQQMVFTTPTPVYTNVPPNYSQVQTKIFMATSATQTSLVDVRKAAK